MTQPDKHFVFRLYSANRNVEMERLMQQLKQVMSKYFPGDVQTEIIDVLMDPERAVQDNVFGTPMLVKHLPEPSQRVLGDLSDPKKILVLFGLLQEKANE
jgi:circadian clock protein KaiB